MPLILNAHCKRALEVPSRIGNFLRNLAPDNPILRRVPHLELAPRNLRGGNNFKIGEWHEVPDFQLALAYDGQGRRLHPTNADDSPRTLTQDDSRGAGDVSVTAAGGMSTSIASFANWLRFHLGKGEFEGQRFLSPGLIQELQKPRVHVGSPEFAEYSDVHYGLGFRSHRYRGERVVWHGGGFTGTNTLMMMLPDRGLGIGVLANNGMTPLFAPHVLANYVFDHVCGKEPAPWLERFRERRRKFVAQQDVDRQAGKASRRPVTQSNRDLADYAGDYEHPGYGRITITYAESKLHWAFRGMSEPLVHRHNDTFELPEEPESPGGLLPGQLTISFSTDREGNIASVAVPLEPRVKDIAFTRIAVGDRTPL